MRLLVFSSASLWEIVIKAALRRPDFKVDVALLRPSPRAWPSRSSS